MRVLPPSRHSLYDFMFKHKDNCIFPTDGYVNLLNSAAFERFTISCIEAARVLNVYRNVIHSISYSFIFRGTFFC
jgi:hypothetical protein